MLTHKDLTETLLEKQVYPGSQHHVIQLKASGNWTLLSRFVLYLFYCPPIFISDTSFNKYLLKTHYMYNALLGTEVRAMNRAHHIASSQSLQPELEVGLERGGGNVSWWKAPQPFEARQRCGLWERPAHHHRRPRTTPIQERWPKASLHISKPPWK